MANKYWYEEGMCKALGYKGHWPISYTLSGETVYRKDCMACNMILDGRCTIYDNCEVFLSAPEEMKNNWQLREKKMG